MARRKTLVSETRRYAVKTVAEARVIVCGWLRELGFDAIVKTGLPEVDDRYHVWRIPLKSQGEAVIGEIVVDAYTSEIDLRRTTKPALIEARLHRGEAKSESKPGARCEYAAASLENTIGLGDSVELLEELPAESIDLVFTSPPYFNARPQYSEFEEYDHYLLMMREIIKRVHRVLKDGRFFVINTAPILLRRATRSESSRRIAVPFDLHRLFIEEGYDFVDDIIWVKPEGAGWATGRGRRFAADRNPMQYKSVPVTEYVLVYRKKTGRLIDWHIRNHPDPSVVERSKIGDAYERTNIWRIHPASNSKHPAAFPVELAKKVITYYSFIGDVVLDPFAGSGTVGAAAASLERKFVLFDNNPEYVAWMRDSAIKWMAESGREGVCKNVDPNRTATDLRS